MAVFTLMYLTGLGSIRCFKPYRRTSSSKIHLDEKNDKSIKLCKFDKGNCVLTINYYNYYAKPDDEKKKFFLLTLK